MLYFLTDQTAQATDAANNLALSIKRFCTSVSSIYGFQVWQFRFSDDNISRSI